MKTPKGPHVAVKHPPFFSNDLNNVRTYFRSPSGPPSSLPLFDDAATGTGARFAGTAAATFSAPRARARGLAMTDATDAAPMPLPGAATFEMRAPRPLAVVLGRAFAWAAEGGGAKTGAATGAGGIAAIIIAATGAGSSTATAGGGALAGDVDPE